MSVTILHIWEANAARNEPEAPHPRRTAARTQAYIELIIKHLYKPVPAHRRETSALNPLWSPPPVGMLVVFV